MGLAAELLASSLVGGAIGYFTNYVAILMLFRPRKPYRIPLLGITIQGLIPSKKAEIAESLAEIVHQYLSGEALKSEIRRSIKEAVRDSVKKVLTATLYKRQTALAFIPVQLIDAIADTLAETIVSIVADRLAQTAAEKVDFVTVVRNEVARLNDEDIEKMFWTLSRKQFRFIEIAGFILGALIGPIQLLILRFMG